MTLVDCYTSYYCLSMQHNRVRERRNSPQSTDTRIEASTGSHLRITAWLFEHAELQRIPHENYSPIFFRVNSQLPWRDFKPLEEYYFVAHQLLHKNSCQLRVSKLSKPLISMRATAFNIIDIRQLF